MQWIIIHLKSLQKVWTRLKTCFYPFPFFRPWCVILKHKPYNHAPISFFYLASYKTISLCHMYVIVILGLFRNNAKAFYHLAFLFNHRMYFLLGCAIPINATKDKQKTRFVFDFPFLLL